MIRIKVEKEQGSCRTFDCRGHADFAEEGSDIVCSAVSALVITIFNAMEKYTEDRFLLTAESGLISARFDEPGSPEGRLLMDTLLLGLTEIEEEYPKYLKVSVREV